MDPLTHSLFGAVVSRTPAVRRIPLSMPTLVLAANAPDIDAAMYLFGASDLELLLRRGWTHGPIAMLLFPVTLAALVQACGRLGRSNDRASPTFASLVVLSALGTWSHPLLDWLNTYGVRFLMPFDGTWFYGDVLFIADPWIWLLLAGALVLGGSRSRGSSIAWGVLAAVASFLLVVATSSDLWLARTLWFAALLTLVVLSVRGSFHDSGRRGTLASVALVMLAVYGSFMLGTGRLARASVLGEERRKDPSVTDVFVGPRAVDIFAKDVIVVRDGSYTPGSWHWLRDDRLILGEEEPRSVGDAVFAAAMADPCISGFANWARFPVHRESAHPDGVEVGIYDLRYSPTRGEGFGSVRVVVQETRTAPQAPDGTAQVPDAVTEP